MTDVIATIAFIDYFRGLPALDKMFFLCAFGGGILFVARAILAFFGGGADEADIPDTDIDVATDTGAESTQSFEILTIQGITGFFLMFGLVGLAISRGTGSKLASMAGVELPGYLGKLSNDAAPATTAPEPPSRKPS